MANPSKKSLPNKPLKEEPVGFFKKFLEYQTFVLDTLKEIIQKEFHQGTFDKNLRLANIDVYRELEKIRGKANNKSTLDHEDIRTIEKKVIPLDPDGSYIAQHQSLYVAIRVYRFLDKATPQLETMSEKKWEAFSSKAEEALRMLKEELSKNQQQGYKIGLWARHDAGAVNDVLLVNENEPRVRKRRSS
jgi:hypothetical protein